jgi:integrase/recombinase XerD
MRIILDKRTKRKDGKYPLSLYCYVNGSARFISLKYYFAEKEYKVIENNQTNRAIEFNNKLNGYLMKANRIMATLNPFDFKKFKELFWREEIDVKPKSVFLKDAFDEIISLKKSEGDIKTASTYKNAISSLSKFLNPLRIEDITPNFLKKYQEWYVENHNGVLTASVGINLRNLRAVLNRLASDKRLPPDFEYPFGRNKFQIRYKRKPKRTLTKEEIETLVKIDEFTCDDERRARDYWLLQFYCNGINLKDLLLLRWDNRIQSVGVEGDFFTIKRQKTKQTSNVDRVIRIPISKKLKKLIDLYGDKNSPFVLGLVDEKMTESQIINRKERVGDFMNTHLKNIGKRYNFSFPLTSKISRDAYATTLRRNGVSIEIISQNLGHSSVMITMHYLEDFGFDVINDSNDCLP